MIRMTLIGTRLRTLRLEGRLTVRVLPELRRTCLDAAVGAPLSVDLSGVRFMDAPGVEFIRRLPDLGIRVKGGSPFINELLKECRT